LPSLTAQPATICWHAGRNEHQTKSRQIGGFNIGDQKHPDFSKIVVVFLIFVRFQKLFAFHFSISPVFLFRFEHHARAALHLHDMSCMP
jgi:hypothetical protein